MVVNLEVLGTYCAFALTGVWHWPPPRGDEERGGRRLRHQRRGRRAVDLQLGGAHCGGLPQLSVRVEPSSGKHIHPGHSGARECLGAGPIAGRRLVPWLGNYLVHDNAPRWFPFSGSAGFCEAYLIGCSARCCIVLRNTDGT